jgi:serine/threonine protein kinase
MATKRVVVIGSRYSLSDEVGRGRSGALRLGRDERTGRRVALEQVGQAGFDSDYLERAEREAQAAAGFEHPHAAKVLDLVLDDQTGLLWLVTEPVEGTTLSDVVPRKGAHDMEFTSDVARQAADALTAAHAAGIVHGNVSPANVWVDRLGQVTVTGFGVARTPARPTTTPTTPTTPTTQHGPVTDSTAYLAPEVAAGHPGDQASDVWSLGATLYFAMTGRPPYDIGTDLLEGLDRIIEDPPPRLPNAGLLASLLEVTMIKDPWRRWSMTAVRDHLTDPPSPATDPLMATPPPQQTAPPMRWGLPVLLTVAVLAAAAFGATKLNRETGPSGLSAAHGPSLRPSLIPPTSATSSTTFSPSASPAASRSPSDRPSPNASSNPSTHATKHVTKHASKPGSKSGSKHGSKSGSKHGSKPHGHQPGPKPRPPRGSKPCPPHGSKPHVPKPHVPKPGPPHSPHGSPPHGSPPHSPPHSSPHGR